MSRLRIAFASLLLASSLGAGCAATATANTLPSAGDTAPSAIAPVQIAPVRIAPDRAALRSALAKRRAVTIERFLAYRDARMYPVVEAMFGFQHVWRDASGNLCAAATLISLDWGRAAAERIATENNQVQLAGITDGALLEWMLTSGLTQHELVAIQVPGFNEARLDRGNEIRRLYAIYVDVERQLNGLAAQSLDQAVDALLARPALARALLDGTIAGPGPYAAPPVG